VTKIYEPGERGAPINPAHCAAAGYVQPNAPRPRQCPIRFKVMRVQDDKLYGFCAIHDPHGPTERKKLEARLQQQREKEKER
jgi:hypothetical protein